MTELNEEIRRSLQEAENFANEDFQTLGAAEARARFSAERAEPGNPTAVQSVDDFKIAAPQGDIPVRIYKPDAQPDAGGALPTLIWFHGGGWVVGDLDTADATCRDLCAFSGSAVISVDYRLAPENPFPAAFDDSIAVIRWVFSNAETRGLATHQIAIGGDSAGANLAACATVFVKDLPITLCAQVLVYPVIDCDFSRSSYIENAEGFGLTTLAMRWFWDQYVPDQASRHDKRVNPLYADLDGLPPALVLTVDKDPLRDDGLAYAAALERYAVPVRSIRSSDTIHGYFGMDLNCSHQSRRQVAMILREMMC